MNDQEFIIYEMVKQIEKLKLENITLNRKLSAAIMQRNKEIILNEVSSNPANSNDSIKQVESKYNTELEAISDLY